MHQGVATKIPVNYIKSGSTSQFCKVYVLSTKQLNVFCTTTYKRMKKSYNKIMKADIYSLLQRRTKIQ